ncbi:hypothetical protein TIFTF001_033211 [Ficus carica]|uniref:Uncharacterized protein n=1 Tax=Ficus carica TaxID=3494 RepID=A0AA88J3F4_FICCA|nr:hypothetical protein TIFTF001_033211 [Ficus carica]
MEAIINYLFSGQDVLMKVGIFVVVQALVYLILSKSSSIFSNSDLKRSHSFRPARSLSIRRIMAALADLPAGSELSPSVPRGPSTPTTHVPSPRPAAAARRQYHSSN